MKGNAFEEVSAYASIDVVESADFNGQISINVRDKMVGSYRF